MRRFAVISVMGLASLVSAAEPNLGDRFYQAVRTGDQPALSRLLSGGADVNTRDSRGDTPLMYAAAVGSIDAMKQLIAAGADVNGRNQFNSAAIMWCSNNLDKVRLLVSKGADVKITTKAGRTPLVVAASHTGNVEVVRLLIEKGADLKSSAGGANAALIAAADANDTATIKLLLEHGAGVKAANPAGFTALANAAGNGNAEAVKLLLARGSDVNAQSAPHGERPVKNGFVAIGSLTPLLLSVTTGSAETVKLLLDAKANVDVKDVRGMTPLMLAVATDHPDARIVWMLIEKHASSGLKSNAGETALDWAVKFQNPSILPMVQKASPGIELAKREAPSITRADRSPREAVEKSVALLQKTTVTFFREGGCISCHAQNIGSAAVAAARSKGIPVDEAAAAEVARGTRLQFAAAADGLLERMDMPTIEIPSQSLFGLSSERAEPDRVTDALVHNIAANQRADGSWVRFGIMRPPTADSGISMTAFAIRALRDYAPAARKAEMDERIARAAQWLLKEEPSTTEDSVTQLLGVSWAGVSGAPIDRLAKRLIGLQRGDGGWAQTPYLKSDAYATATALYALKESGVSGAEGACKKGAAYLLRTQAEDGSWYVASRAPKFQPYFEGGFPYGHDGWISQWATGYAAVALSYGIPENRAAK